MKYNRTELTGNIGFTTVIDKKFKTANITVRFMTKLSENLNLRSFKAGVSRSREIILLPGMLIRGFASCRRPVIPGAMPKSSKCFIRITDFGRFPTTVMVSPLSWIIRTIRSPVCSGIRNWTKINSLQIILPNFTAKAAKRSWLCMTFLKNAICVRAAEVNG